MWTGKGHEDTFKSARLVLHLYVGDGYKGMYVMLKFTGLYT